MPWKYFGLRDLSGKSLGISIFDHPDNLNYPTPWFVVDTEDLPFYYFSPAPVFNQPQVMKKGDDLKLNYRMQFYAGETSRERMEKDFKTYIDIK